MNTVVDTYFSYTDASSGHPTVVVIGNFDGLHRGHMTLLRTAHELAKEKAARFSVLTFSPHPARVLAPERAPPAIMSDVEKKSAFKSVGVDAVWFQSFNLEFAELSPEAFVTDVLKVGVGAAHVVVGFDFRFGKNRAGNTDTLATLLHQHGIGLSVIDAVQDGSAKVSSSAIRDAMRHADIERVNELLGWSYTIEGVVIRGDARGRTLDFPTLNLKLRQQLYPREGVYCGWVEHEGRFRPAVANLGARPTVDDDRRGQLEVHVIRAELGDMYDQVIRFVFCAELRGIERFTDLESLRAQIAKDVMMAQVILKDRAPMALTIL
jgi:riboflavin kinase / FMN adenylyltransferase